MLDQVNETSSQTWLLSGVLEFRKTKLPDDRAKAAKHPFSHFELIRVEHKSHYRTHNWDARTPPHSIKGLMRALVMRHEPRSTKLSSLCPNRDPV